MGYTYLRLAINTPNWNTTPSNLHQQAIKGSTSYRKKLERLFKMGFRQTGLRVGGVTGNTENFLQNLREPSSWESRVPPPKLPPPINKALLRDY